MKKILSGLYYLVFAGIIAIALLLVVSLFPVPGNIEVKVVLSGSMEPAIQVGSIVVIKAEENYEIGDIITFGKDTRDSIPTTHRIHEMRAQAGEIFYQTKGDANEDPDVREIGENEIIGKVTFSIPYLGFVIDFAKRPIGFMLLVVIPAGLIAIDEIRKIWMEIRRIRRQKKTSEE